MALIKQHAWQQQPGERSLQRVVSEFDKCIYLIGQGSSQWG
jgi:hypothetical protein